MSAGDPFSNAIARFLASLNSNGSLDTSFRCNMEAVLFSVVVQDDGKILIGGKSTSVDGIPRRGVARLNNDCSLDPRFDRGTGTYGWSYRVALQDNGKIFIIGNFIRYNEIARSGIARLNADGSLDLSFNTRTAYNSQLYAQIEALAVQPGGKIVITGGFNRIIDLPRQRIARLNADGSFDLSFEPNWILIH